MTRKAGLLKSVLHEVDKNLRGYDATLYDLFKYPFVSYDVDACKNGSSSSQTEHSWFPTCLVTSPFENTFFSKLDVFIMHWQNPKRKWFSMQNCHVNWVAMHNVWKSPKMTHLNIWAFSINFCLIKKWPVW